jgi:hypothetical protein
MKHGLNTDEMSDKEETLQRNGHCGATERRSLHAFCRKGHGARHTKVKNVSAVVAELGKNEGKSGRSLMDKRP